MFYLQALTEAPSGYPLPRYCPFCGSQDMEEVDDVDQIIAETPRLRVIQGGLQNDQFRGDKTSEDQGGDHGRDQGKTDSLEPD